MHPEMVDWLKVYLADHVGDFLFVTERGKPCIRGLRYPIETLLELLSSGMTHREIALEKARTQTGPQKQVNVQINEGLDGSKYSQLVQKLITGEGV